MMDKHWIKRNTSSQTPTNQAIRDISRRALKYAPSKRTRLFGNSAAKRRGAQNAQWDLLKTFRINENHLRAHHVIPATRLDPSCAAMDEMRSRLSNTLRENGWKRVAITSPTCGCGKTIMAARLALSFSRDLTRHAVLLDLDMRQPSVAEVMGLPSPGAIGDVLRGDVAAVQSFQRAGHDHLDVGPTIAIAGNTRREEDASALLQRAESLRAIEQMEEDLSPDVVLYDMPPVLTHDDVVAARDLYDGVLLVIGAGVTNAQDVRDVEHKLGADTPLLDIVLHKPEDNAAKPFDA